MNIRYDFGSQARLHLFSHGNKYTNTTRLPHFTACALPIRTSGDFAICPLLHIRDTSLYERPSFNALQPARALLRPALVPRAEHLWRLYWS